MLIKICGITTLEDALAAAHAGATHLGFNFWPSSPRFVEPERAAEIAALLPDSVAAVGVFVNASEEDVARIAAVAGIRIVQAHGDEPPAFCADTGLLRIKALGDGPDLVRRAREYEKWEYVLVDARDPVLRGGTGRRADWARASALAKSRPVILAGGLTPKNVAAAVREVRPAGVDTASGVERAAGIKNHRRMAAFAAAARGAAGPESPSP